MKITKVKTKRFLAIPIFAIVSSLLLALPAVAQDDRDRDGDRRDRDYRRDRDSRDRDRDIEREKWKQKFDMEDWLRRLDDDKNGVLEGKELKGDRTRQYLSKMGINVNDPVRIDVAVKKAKATYASKRDAERKKFEDQVGPKLNTFGTETEAMGISQFGSSEAKEPMVASFDERLTGLKMSDFDEKTMKEARKVLDGYDRDKSGFLEGDEINRVRWRDPKPAESDLNSDGRISLLEMAQRISNRSDERGSRSDRGDNRWDRDYDRDRRSSKSSSGRSYASGRGTSSKTAARSSGSAGGDSAFANYIDGVFKKYDTNGDGRLAQDELKKMRRPLKGDANSDGFLSKKEATDYIKGGKNTSSKGLKATATNAGDDSDEGNPANVASRKYTPPKSSGARSGARSKSGTSSRGSLGSLDANEDGQIQMSEFSSSWNEETLQKFRKTDTDDDGIISAEEWAARPK